MLAIGWLEFGHSFSQGHVDEEIVERAEKIQKESRDRFLMYVYRGLHGCSFCTSKKARRGIPESNTNVLVPGNECVYVASGGLCHYIKFHSYRPPEEFIHALSECPFPSSSEYDSEIIRANRGIKPDFLWSIEEFMEKSKRGKSEPATEGDA